MIFIPINFRQFVLRGFKLRIIYVEHIMIIVGETIKAMINIGNKKDR